MILVLDASAAAELIMHRPNGGRIAAALSGAERVLAPGLYCYEITNVFWKYYALGRVPLSVCEQALRRGLALPDELIAGTELAVEAFALAGLTRLSAYDMFYAVLARRFGGVLATMDQKLQAAARQHNIGVLG